MGRIELYSGKYFDPENLDALEIRIDDIAHSLSNICRYNGHSEKFYSVAEHSVLVANCLLKMGHDMNTCLWGLLHDAPETYIGDIPAPLKCYPLVTDRFEEIEGDLMYRIANRFGVSGGMIPEVVDTVDKSMYYYEAKELLCSRGYSAPVFTLRLPVDRLFLWTPEQAFEQFMNLFIYLKTEES